MSGLMNCITNVVKAGVAVAAAPVVLVADVVTLPSSAYNSRHPFGRAGKMLGQAGKCIAEAVSPVGSVKDGKEKA